MLLGSIPSSLPRTPLPNESHPSANDQASLASVRQSQASYHFHGLAPTQSQSQRDASLAREASLKENAPASGSWESPGFKVPGTSVTPVPVGVTAVSKPGEADMVVDEPEGSPVTLPCAVVAPAPPNRPTGTAAPPCTSRRDSANNAPNAKGRGRQLSSSTNHLRKRQRSVSPMSDDSFAGPLPKELEIKKYVNETRAFQIPLSQLGQTQEDSAIEAAPQDDGEDITFTSARDLHDRDQGAGPSRTRFRDLSVTRTSSQSQPVGSQEDLSQSQPRMFSSGFSQSHGQGYDDDDDFAPGAQPRDSQGSDFGPVAYTQTDSEPDSVPPRFSTQSTDPGSPQATQPTDDGAPPAVFASPPEQSGVTSTTNGPRSILTLVNPQKRWRFQGNDHAFAQAHALHQRTQATQFEEEPVAGPSNWEETQPSEASDLPATGNLEHQDGVIGGAGDNDYEETQPSEASNLPNTGQLARREDEELDDENNDGETQPSLASNLPSTGLVLYPSTSSRAAVCGTGSHERQAPSDMEIIPDSEPPDPSPDPHPASLLVVPQPAESPQRHSPGTLPGRTAEEVEELLKVGSEDEDEDDEDDDLPLAVVKGQQSKPRSKPQSKPRSKPVERDSSGTLMPPPRKRTRTDPTPSKASFAQAGSLRSEDEIIPSSDPQERLESAAPPSKTARTSRAKPKRAATAPSGAAPVTPAPRKRHSPEDEDADPSASDDAADDAQDEDMRTEIADDESYQPPARGSTARKRKRVPSSSAKGSAKSLRATTSTPPVKSARRLKSISVARSLSVAPTRVFALWKQDSSYYAGVVHAECETASQKYHVKFDDGAEDMVDLLKLRRCELRKGDFVLISHKTLLKAEVVDGSRCNTELKVTVRVNDGDDDDDVLEVDTSAIQIPGRSIVSRWADRALTADEIVTVVRPKHAKQSPTPTRASEISTWSKSTSKIFNKTGFVMTTTPGYDDWTREKGVYEAWVRENGGTVIEDWCQVFKMDGKTTMQGKRWELEKEEVHLMMKELDRVFLLSDDASHKPKFLIALALGIPCVKLEWLADSVAEVCSSPLHCCRALIIFFQSAERDWLQYLLPAGTSEKLNGRITQMVDCDWGSCPEHIQEITENTVPFKLFAGEKILCVAQEFLPGKLSRRVSAFFVQHYCLRPDTMTRVTRMWTNRARRRA